MRTALKSQGWLGAARLALLLIPTVAPLDALAQATPQSRAEIQLSFAPVVKTAAPAVANIYAQTLVQRRVSPMSGDPFFDRFFGRLQGPGLTRRRLEQSLGSGVIVSPDGLVVTNAHVIENAVEITVALNDRREFEAQAVLVDEASDIAVLQLEGGRDLPTLPFGDSDAVEVGDLVLAIGNPFGVGQTVTSGIISAAARTGSDGRTFLQTDAAINPGNSGGALVDMAGRLVGVNSAILTRSGGSNGVGFAIPSNLVARAVAQAEAGAARFSRPWLGVEGHPVDGSVAEALGMSRPRGVILTDVHPASPFATAGLDVGMVVLSVDGAPVNDMSALAFRLAEKGVGADVLLEGVRAGGTFSARLALISAPEDPPREETTLNGRSTLAGLTVANLNPALAEEIKEVLGRAPAGSGVVVLDADGPASRLDLELGDMILTFNGVRTPTVAALEAALRRGPRLRALELRRDRRRLTFHYR